MKEYRIYVANENNVYDVPIREDGHILSFDCIFAAERYAAAVGLKSGYKVK